MSGCIFCAIVEGRAPSHRVYEDGHAIAFMDIFPITEGHTLVIPRIHSPDLWTIPEDDAAATMRAAVRVGKMLRAVLSPDGMNMIQATGAVAYQTVFHYHLHLVPRYRGDGVRFGVPRTPASQEALASLAERVRSVEAPAG